MTEQRPDILLFEGEELCLEGIPRLPKDALQVPTGRRALIQRSALSLASHLSALTNEDDFLFLTGRREPPDAARSEPGDPGPALNAELLRALEAGGNRLTESWHRAALRVEVERSLVSTLKGLNRELQPGSGDEPSPPTAIDDCRDPEELERRLDRLSEERERRISRTEHRKSVGLDESTALEPATRAELVAETIRTLRFVPFRYGGGPGTINTSCHRGYIATWEVRGDRFLLVKVDGTPSFYPDEPVLATWIDGWLAAPQGTLLKSFFFADLVENIYSNYLLIRVESGRVVEVRSVLARERFPDLDKRIAREAAEKQAKRRFEAERDRLAEEFGPLIRASRSEIERERLGLELQERVRALRKLCWPPGYGLGPDDPDEHQQVH